MDYTKATITELQAESDRVEGAIGEAERCLADFRSMFEDVRRELQRRLKPSPEPRVSDHALLRYMERILEIDTEQLRKKILTENVRAALKSGATGVKVDGISFVAKNGTIVSVVPKKTPRKSFPENGRDHDDMKEQLLEMDT